MNAFTNMSRTLPDRSAYFFGDLGLQYLVV